MAVPRPPSRGCTGTALHVALARLAGYRWPAESRSEDAPRARGARLDREGGETARRRCRWPALPARGCWRARARRSAARLPRRRLRQGLVGRNRATATAETDERFENKPPRDTSLEGWLRDRAFRQHCALFHNRPFLWHIWDGQKDGFAAIVYYHRLNRANLEKLTFSLLGDWISSHEGC